MIIIGLLIAGVLKGQALIQNAQVTSTVAQVKAIEAAVSTFVDTYSAIPGDLVNPATRLPSCANACIVGAGANNGNGHLENTPAVTPIATEGEAFFSQLSAAGLLTGLTGGAAGSTTVNGNFPGTKIANNVLLAGSARNNIVGDFSPVLLGAGVPDQGLYLTINNSIAAPVAATTGLKPDQAGRLDTKIDDGVPDTGIVRAFGTAGVVANAINCGSLSSGRRSRRVCDRHRSRSMRIAYPHTELTTSFSHRRKGPPEEGPFLFQFHPDLQRAFSISSFTNAHRRTGRARLFDEEGRRQFFSEEEREAFITAAASAPDTTETFCGLLHYTGCNFTEALNLTALQVDFSRRAIVFEAKIRGLYVYNRAVPVPTPSSSCSIRCMMCAALNPARKPVSDCGRKAKRRCTTRLAGSLPRPVSREARMPSPRESAWFSRSRDLQAHHSDPDG